MSSILRHFRQFIPTIKPNPTVGEINLESDKLKVRKKGLEAHLASSFKKADLGKLFLRFHNAIGFPDLSAAFSHQTHLASGAKRVISHIQSAKGSVSLSGTYTSQVQGEEKHYHHVTVSHQGKLRNPLEAGALLSWQNGAGVAMAGAHETFLTSAVFFVSTLDQMSFTLNSKRNINIIGEQLFLRQFGHMPATKRWNKGKYVIEDSSFKQRGRLECIPLKLSNRPNEDLWLFVYLNLKDPENGEYYTANNIQLDDEIAGIMDQLAENPDIIKSLSKAYGKNIEEIYDTANTELIQITGIRL